MLCRPWLPLLSVVALTLPAVLGSFGCGESRSAPPLLEHDAYVWQQRWSPALTAAAAAPPAPVGALRVLAVEVVPTGEVVSFRRPDVDTRALAASGRPVTAVVRVHGSRLPVSSGSPFTLHDVAPLLVAWREAGIDVAGVEVDHDCATAALDDYASWLEANRPPPGLRMSITALPTWTTEPALARIADIVDEVVLQVHAVRAPVLFDVAEARVWAEQYARAVGRPFRLALPTYRVRLGDDVVGASPEEVSGFVRDLAQRPVRGLLGLVWFRLPAADDVDAWTASTLTAVAEGAPLAPSWEVRVEPAADGALDLVVTNRGNVDAPAPVLWLSGDVELADAVGPFLFDGSRLTPTSRAVVRAGETLLAGWARGRGVKLDVRHAARP